MRFRKTKKVLAGILVASMVLTSNGFVSLATGYDEQSIGTDTQKVETFNDENLSSGEGQSQNTTENMTASEESLDAAEAGIYLNYFVLGSSVISTPTSQYAVADIGDGSKKIDQAKLTYKNVTTGDSFETEVTTIDGTSLVFNMDFTDKTIDYSGEYKVLSLEVKCDDTLYTIDIESTGVQANFGVNTYVESNADIEFVEEDQETACDEDPIVITDADGNVLTEKDLAETLDTAQLENSEDQLLQGSANQDLVVVIDPGHGGSDSGACGNGLREADLCLAISNACKTELEKYSHCQVYMTRTTDVFVGLVERVEIAEKYDPDIFVCIHINAGGGTGAEVYYPNSNYISAIGKEGNELASKVQEKLVALGFVNRGVKIRNTENGSKYPDGSPSDYLSVIHNSKRRGFPAILIEHGFIDNASDVSNFLSSSDKLKKLGIADATAIAQYYGLSKTGDYPTKTTIADTIRDATQGASEPNLTPIMNKPTTTVEKMVKYYKSKAKYPKFYANTDAPDIETFCKFYYKEAVAEGVDPGVAFAQAMKETGFLRYGGQVKIEQFNFAGLGALDSGESGASFSKVRLGIRAQIQHLKAYASLEKLNKDCVDPRFSLVTRGCAQYVQYLGQKENPYGKGWATDANYGISIVNEYMSNFCTFKNNSASVLKVSYQSHVQGYGWQNVKSNGTTSGTTGFDKRIEAIRINISGNYRLGVRYRTCMESNGWMKWRKNGLTSGITGKSKRMEAFQAVLTGKDASKFDILYRTYVESFGWLGWAKNGGSAGTEGLGKRVEAIQIIVVPKGVLPTEGTQLIPYVQTGSTATDAKGTMGLVNYRARVQGKGKQKFVSDGSLAGTVGQSRKIECIYIKVNTKELGVSGGIKYRVCTNGKKFGSWVQNGKACGGKNKRVEAIQIKLTGQLAKKYDVYYRAHSQSYGWQAWTKNGKSCGTMGKGKRLEGYQVVLVPKGGSAPSIAPARMTTRSFYRKK